MLTIKKLEQGPGSIRVDYDLTHSTPGRDGTTLRAPLTVFIAAHQTHCRLEIDRCEGLTADESLAKMSAWLRRLADGIDQRGSGLNIPL